MIDPTDATLLNHLAQCPATESHNQEGYGDEGSHREGEETRSSQTNGRKKGHPT